MTRSAIRFRAPAHGLVIPLIGLSMLLGLRGLQIIPVQAQEQARVPAKEETLRLFAGDVLEILGTNDDRGAQYAWIMEKDGAFLQAAHQQTFRTRLTEPGAYRLDATASAADGAPLAHRILVIDVRERTTGGEEPPTTGAATEESVTTDPPLIEGTLTLPANTRFFTILPRTQDALRLTLDIDAAVDSDGNGNARDDNDTAQTFFGGGNVPLVLWLSSPRPEREMQVIAFRNDGTSTAQTLRIVENAEGTSASPEVPQDGPILATQTSDGSLQFSLPELQNLAIPVLSYWSFGDGTESLIQAPDHRYARSGTYEVRVRLVDLRSGQSVFEATRSLSVNAEVPVEGSSSSIATSATSSETVAPVTSSSASSVTSEPSTQPSGTGILGLLLRIALIFTGAVVVGGAGTWIVGKILRSRGSGGLQKTFENMEAKLSKTDQPATVIDVPPPMTIRRPEPVEPEPFITTEKVSETEPSDTILESATPRIEMENAPSWLRQGMEMGTSSAPAAEESPIETPPQEPPATPAAAPSTPSPAALAPVFSTPPPPSPIAEENVPPWLRGSTMIPSPSPTTAQTETVTSPSLEKEAEDISATSLPPSAPVIPEPPNIPEPPPPQPTVPSPVEPVKTQTKPERPVTPPPAAPPSPSTPSQDDKDHSTALPSSPQQQLSPEERQRQEREREKKRLKRKRYRENLKKRTEERSAVSGQRLEAPAPQNDSSQNKTPPSPFYRTPGEQKNPQPTIPSQSPPQQVPPEKAVTAPAPSPSTAPQEQKTEKKGEKPADDNVVFMVEAEGLKKPENGAAV